MQTSFRSKGYLISPKPCQTPDTKFENSILECCCFKHVLCRVVGAGGAFIVKFLAGEPPEGSPRFQPSTGKSPTSSGAKDVQRGFIGLGLGFTGFKVQGFGLRAKGEGLGSMCTKT